MESNNKTEVRIGDTFGRLTLTKPRWKHRYLKEGDKFNLLTIIKLKSKQKGTRTDWLHECKCDCGNIFYVEGHKLLSEQHRSCGCDRYYKNGKIIGLMRRILKDYKESSELRKLAWELSDEEALNMLSAPCYYCGTERSNIIKNKIKGAFWEYNGIDRIINSEGYTVLNSVSCCKPCNKMKWAFPLGDFLKYIQRISEHLNLNSSSTILNITGN